MSLLYSLYHSCVINNSLTPEMEPPQDLVPNSAVARVTVTETSTLGFCLKLVTASFSFSFLKSVPGEQKVISYFNSSYSVKPPVLITRFYGVYIFFFVSFAVPHLVLFYSRKSQRRGNHNFVEE